MRLFLLVLILTSTIGIGGCAKISKKSANQTSSQSSENSSSLVGTLIGTTVHIYPSSNHISQILAAGVLNPPIILTVKDSKLNYISIYVELRAETSEYATESFKDIWNLNDSSQEEYRLHSLKHGCAAMIQNGEIRDIKGVCVEKVVISVPDSLDAVRTFYMGKPLFKSKIRKDDLLEVLAFNQSNYEGNHQLILRYLKQSSTQKITMFELHLFLVSLNGDETKLEIIKQAALKVKNREDYLQLDSKQFSIESNYIKALKMLKP